MFQPIGLTERAAAVTWPAWGFGRPDPVGWSVDSKLAAVGLLSTVDLDFAAAEVTKVQTSLGVSTEITQSLFE